MSQLEGTGFRPKAIGMLPRAEPEAARSRVEHTAQKESTVRVTENTEFEVVEPGTYPAEVVEWTDVDQFGKPLMSRGFADREPQPQWRIKFRLDVEGEERFLSAWINKPKGYPESVHPKAKIVELARAVLGDEADTTDWDVPDLIEGTCRVQVEVYDKKDGGEGNGLSKFYPPKPKRGTAPAMAEAMQRAKTVQVPANRRAVAEEEGEPPF